MRRRRTAGVVLSIGLLALTRVSAQENSDAPEPLYPQILVATDDSFSADAGLAAFRSEALKASEARTRIGDYVPYDPKPMQAMMGAQVEIWVGQGTRSYRQDFVSLGLHAPETAMEMVGRLAYPREGGNALVKRRHAMQAIGEMLSDPVVGTTPWLDGRICTASYGKVSWPDWMVLSQNLKWGDTEWVITVEAKLDEEDRWQHADPEWPKRFQLVPVSPEQKRAGGWLGVLSPEGGRFFFRTLFGDDISYFAPYLNNHVCFGRQGEEWKITGVAVRLER